MINKQSRIFLAGHNGMVGSAFHRLLKSEGYTNIITAPRSEVNLTSTISVHNFFKKTSPEYIIMAAAKVGGIKANMEQQADFLHQNLMIQQNLFNLSREFGVKKNLFLGSSCIYPKDAPQPIKEEYLLTGPLEPTNEGYAIAKISGIKMAQYLQQQYGVKSVCGMPCNLYGTNDHFGEGGHVLSATIKRFVDAKDDGLKEVTMWGTGIARREFLHVDDCAQGAWLLFNKVETPDVHNIGSGTDVTIKELAEMVAKQVGFEGKINWDETKPNGMLRKCMNVDKITVLGFKPKISLEQGIKQTIAEYRKAKEEDLVKS